jgi:hypothetical protein
VGRVTRNQADFNVAATATSCWILAATSTSQASRPEFQHSSSTFGPGILAITMGTFSWRASPIVGNASMDYTDNAATFFFTTDGKTYSCLSIVTFIIRANIKCLANSSIYVFKQPSSSVGRDFVDAVLNVGGSNEGNGGGNGNDAAP